MSTDTVPSPAPPRSRWPSLIDWCEAGYVPDALARFGMRRLIGQRLAEESRGGAAATTRRLASLVDELRRSPIAIATAAANAQHYEVPAAFFRLHLGPRLKYSCCLYQDRATTLAAAEDAMLECYAERAGLADGQHILDLGCGWGSFSLWAAERYPNATIVGLSNSHGQREFIEARASERGLSNLRIVTADIVDVVLPDAIRGSGFDRVVSIEMFEHMKNYALLFRKIAGWMKDDGRMFVHIFAHRTLAYPFAVRDRTDWMSQYFFTGGIMPSADLFRHFQDELCVTDTWWVDGTHYARTAEDWLARLDGVRPAVLELFGAAYGTQQAAVWLQRWRMFYMAVAELFGFRGGTQWGVAHYLFDKRRS